MVSVSLRRLHGGSSDEEACICNGIALDKESGTESIVERMGRMSRNVSSRIHSKETDLTRPTRDIQRPFFRHHIRYIVPHQQGRCFLRW